eukprot:4340771-Pleurochrysis_carterae.AAC.1
MLTADIVNVAPTLALALPPPLSLRSAASLPCAPLACPCCAAPSECLKRMRKRCDTSHSVANATAMNLLPTPSIESHPASCAACSVDESECHVSSALRASLTASSKLCASGRKRSGRGKVGAKASVRSSAARRVALPSHGAQAAALPKHTLAPSGGDDGEGANKAGSDDDDEGSDDDDGDDDGDGDGDGAVLASLRVTRVAGRAESIAKQASSADSLADRVHAQLRQMVKERAEDGTLAAEFVEE